MLTSYGSGYTGSEFAVIATDRASRLDGTRQGVLYGHGAGQVGWTIFPTSQVIQPITLTQAGYPFIAADLGATTTNWGNDASIASMGAAVTALANAGAKAGKVCLLGVSMGALILNWAIQNPTKVTAIFLLIPAGNVNDIYQNNKGGYQASIGVAYGVTFPAAIPNLTTHSPLDYGSAQLAALAGIPIQIWASDNDPIAMDAAVCETWAASVNAVGGNVTVNSLGAIGHNEGDGRPIQILQHFNANGGLT